MKRTLVTLAIIIALIVGAVAIGWLYFRANPDAWDDFSAQMQGEQTGGIPARPARREIGGAGELVASGTIEAEQITVASEWGGRLLTLAVDEGDQVQAGDQLLELDTQALLAQREGVQAAIAQAQAAVDAAGAQLAQAMAGALAEEIATAEGAVLAAQGGVAAAEASLQGATVNVAIALGNRQAQSGVTIAEANQAQAEGMLSAAEAELEMAQMELAGALAGARPQEIALYQAFLDQAEAELWFPQQAHEQLLHNEIYGTMEEEARYQVAAIQAARDAAQAQLDLVLAGATAQEIAAVRAGVAAAEAQVSIAQAGVEAAAAGVEQAQDALETSQNQIALAEAEVAAAQAQVEIADGQLMQAEAGRDQLLRGATAEEIAALEAQVAQAEAALAEAQAAIRALDIQLAQMTVAAPSGGVILERLIHVGELAAPGAPLLTLADLDEVTLTVYVPEADLGRVSLGQTVEVSVDAYEDVFIGSVSHIADQAEFTPKNIQTQEERVHMVFAVKVRLENADHRLKAGMPADAVFQ